MSYLGDYPEDATVYCMWSTNDADGASITRATDGTVSVYKDDGTTQSVAGITDTEDFDSLTGIHSLKIDTSADAFYATGHDYTIVLSAATIDGQTVNAVLHHFSIENRTTSSVLTMLGTAVALDGGAATIAGMLTKMADDNGGADFDAGTDSLQELRDHIGDGTNLTEAGGDGDHLTEAGGDGDHLVEAGGTGDQLTAVPWNAAWDAEVQSEANDALVALNLDHLCAVATGAADMTTEVIDNSILSRVLANGDTSAFDPSTDGLQPIRDHIGDGTNLTEAGGDGDHLTEVGLTDGAVTAAKLGADCITNAKIADDAIAAENLATGAIAADGLAADAANEIADAVLCRDWTSVSGEAARSALNALRFLRNKWSISGPTLTVTEEDDSTTAWTSTVTTDGGADPVTASDPT